MSQNNNAQELLSASMQNLRELVDVNTVVGEPITTPDGTTIIPISKVSFGFASGGSDFPSKAENKMFGGGGGGGVTISPLAFLIVSGGQVKLLQMSANSGTADKVVGMVPDVIDKVSELFHKQSRCV